jgi:alpha/beta superfamily hydrolase
MTNKVVTTLARSFARLGADAVRFNFRGVGKSAGTYADGIGERDDALAVVAWARARWPGRPLYLGGFSFGAAVAAAIAARVAPAGLVTVAPPVDRLPTGFAPPACPWLLIHGDADDVVPAAPVVEWSAKLPLAPRVVVLPGVGHFFHGRLAALTEAVNTAFGADLAALRGRHAG